MRLSACWLAASVLLLGGCVTAKVTYDDDADFATYKTFAQAPPPKQGANLVGYSSIVGRQIQDEIAKQLEAKGFRSASPQSADLIVAISISGQRRADVVSDGFGWYGGYGDTYTVRYVEGTLVIDVFDREKKRLLFHGWEQQRLFGSGADSDKVIKAVQDIMEKFPPEKKSWACHHGSPALKRALGTERKPKGPAARPAATRVGGSEGVVDIVEPALGADLQLTQELEDVRALARSLDFIESSVRAGKPFFLWVNPARMHVYTHLSEKYLNMMTPENEWTIQEAGMKEMDDMVGALLKALDDHGIADNTIIAVTSDNGAEVFTWPDGGMTPFRGTKGMVNEGGFRSPWVMRWPGKIKPGRVSNEVVSGLDWFPTFVAAAGGSRDAADLRKGAKLNGKNYKVHLDGYNQLDLITQGAPSKRQEIWYFAEAELGAARIGNFKFIFLDQPTGWFGSKVTLDWPKLVNLRLDPFERCINFADCPSNLMDWFAHEFWRFTFVQKEVAKLAKTFIEYPPQQAPASFNLDQVKAKIRAMREKIKHGGVAN